MNIHISTYKILFIYLYYMYINIKYDVYTWYINRDDNYQSSGEEIKKSKFKFQIKERLFCNIVQREYKH